MTPLTPEQVRDLADKWLKGTLTTAERQLFDQWYSEQPPETLSWKKDARESVLKERLFSNITHQLAAVDTNASNTETITNPTIPAPQPTLHIRRRFTIPAAAAIIILLMAGAFLWSRYPARKEIAALPTSHHPGNNLAPGSNKATLTLGDGSVLTLDSTATGALAQQGNTRITNLSSGQLIYNPVPGSAEAATPPTAILYNTITTARSGQYRLGLPDGTTVWLNAASSLRFPTTFTGDTRTVELKGEAYFEVAKNAAMPFHVKLAAPACESDIEVLGTSFDVNAYEDEPLIRTTLVEGAVRIRNKTSATLLHPGQQAQLTASTPIRIKDDASIEEAIAWKNNLFYFKSADIHTIMRQLSRWYDVDVEYRGAAANNARFNTEIPRNTPASDILRALELTGKAKFTIINKKIIVAMD